MRLHAGNGGVNIEARISDRHLLRVKAKRSQFTHEEFSHRGFIAGDGFNVYELADELKDALRGHQRRITKEASVPVLKRRESIYNVWFK